MTRPPMFGSEAFTGSTEMDREDQWDVVTPEAELSDHQHAGDEYADVDHRQRF